MRQELMPIWSWPLVKSVMVEMPTVALDRELKLLIRFLLAGDINFITVLKYVRSTAANQFDYYSAC
jgi:hypothetical protein